ncbi:hypothetical protein [Solimonas marina]|uniref:Uncharacterized protein n=1 Tax=Solimonas marina TaxID=2714601 RepID=A0A969WC39_9GAMM|nr:hypothetical protein [Solimonas marina]NKF23818.1 hypothetical protein [Solimonas marina]
MWFSSDASGGLIGLHVRTPIALNLQRWRHRQIAWLLAALCVLGSTLTIVHDAWHWQPHVGEHACVLCLHHGGQNEIGSTPPPLTLLRATYELPGPLSLHDVELAARRRPPIRGPPPTSA